MRIKLFTNAYLTDLAAGLKNGDTVNLYSEYNFPVKEECVWEHPTISIENNIKLKEPKDNNRTGYEFENGKILFESFKGLKPDYATDRRIWTCLTHTILWHYMKKRAPLPENESEDRVINHILTHWFLVGTSPKYLMRNDISRLWWITYLTHDPNRKDPYELTRLAFQDLDLTRTIFEGYQGRNRKLVHAILEYECNNRKLFLKFREPKYRFLMRMVNFCGSYKILSSLSKSQIEKVLMKYEDQLENGTKKEDFEK